MVDLTAVGGAVIRLGGIFGSINMLVPAELVTDHLMQVDQRGTLVSLDHSLGIEMRWGCKASGKVMGHVIPASRGISGDQKLVHRFTPQYAEAFLWEE